MNCGDAYEVCKPQVLRELQSRLMRIRRIVLEGLHDSLGLYDENTDLREQLRGAQEEIRQLRTMEAYRSPPESLPDLTGAVSIG